MIDPNYIDILERLVRIEAKLDAVLDPDLAPLQALLPQIWAAVGPLSFQLSDLNIGDCDLGSLSLPQLGMLFRRNNHRVIKCGNDAVFKIDRVRRRQWKVTPVTPSDEPPPEGSKFPSLHIVQTRKGQREK